MRRGVASSGCMMSSKFETRVSSVIHSPAGRHPQESLYADYFDSVYTDMETWSRLLAGARQHGGLRLGVRPQRRQQRRRRSGKVILSRKGRQRLSQRLQRRPSEIRLLAACTE